MALSKTKQQSHTDKTRVGFKAGYIREKKRIGKDREGNTDRESNPPTVCLTTISTTKDINECLSLVNV